MIEYEEDWILRVLFRYEGSVVLKSLIYSMPAVVISTMLLYMDEWEPDFREEYGLVNLDKSQIWAATTGVLFTLLAFRIREAWGRFWEGTGLLHQMRGEWFDTISNLVTFSIRARKERKEEVDTFRHTIVRLMSLCHGAALEEIADNSFKLESIDTFGLSKETLNHVQDCYLNYNFNKVEVMVHMLQSLITNAHDTGILNIPAPILSRVYQTTSRGFVNLLNAKKIQDTKFPFPLAQVIYFLLVSSLVVMPLQISTFISSKVLCAVVSFLPVWGAFCLNFVAQELENPFGEDLNDLPLEHFQTDMNNCLMMLLHPNTDIMAGLNPNAQKDFQNLVSSHKMRDSDTHEDTPPRSATSHRLSAFAPTESGGTNMSSRLSDFTIDKMNSTKSSSSSPRNADILARANAEVQSVKSLLSSQAGSDVASEPPLTSGQDRPDSYPPLTAAMMECGERANANATHDKVAAAATEPVLQIANLHPVLEKTTANSVGKDEHPMLQIDNLRPVLEKTMADVVVSLQGWAENLERQIHDLNSNSIELQSALTQFWQSFPHGENLDALFCGRVRRL